MALLPLQLWPPPLQDGVGWVKGRLAARWNGFLVLSSILWQSQGPVLHQKKHTAFPAESAITCALVTCPLPLHKDILPGQLWFTNNERPLRLSNGTLTKFICRHVPLHWRSLVFSGLCVKNVADQLSLWDNFGILSGKCWVSCDLTWCHRTWLYSSCWL